MSDEVFINVPTQPNLENKERTEAEDTETLVTELNEQERVARETGGIFDQNRVPQPATGVDGSFVINRDHWGE